MRRLIDMLTKLRIIIFFFDALLINLALFLVFLLRFSPRLPQKQGLSL